MYSPQYSTIIWQILSKFNVHSMIQLKANHKQAMIIIARSNYNMVSSMGLVFFNPKSHLAQAICHRFCMCLVPILRKLNNSWWLLNSPTLLSVDKIKHKYEKTVKGNGEHSYQAVWIIIV